MQAKDNNERFFSIELNSKHQIKSISMTEGQKESTLIEGTIGNLVEVTFTEGIVLEVRGTKGTLRLDLQAKEIKVSTQNRGTKMNSQKPVEPMWLSPLAHRSIVKPIPIEPFTKSKGNKSSNKN